MNKRVGAIDEFVIESLTEGSSLHCVLTVSGWIEDVYQHFFSSFSILILFIL